MRAYVDASVLLRLVLGQGDIAAEWDEIDYMVSSQLLRIEALRAIDRARMLQELNDDDLSEARRALFEQLGRIDLIPLDQVVLDRAEMPFTTTLGTLDALHLATAILTRNELEVTALTTHDGQLARAARAEGFDVYGS